MLQVTVTNPLGHATTLTSDGHRGLPVTIVDPNGKTTTAAYDPLGRLTKVWLPGHPTSGTPTLEHAYTLSNTGANVVTTRKIGPNGNQITSFHLFDGRLRPRQTQGPAPVANGGRIITDTAYDARGLPVKQSRFWNSAAPGAALASFADTAVKTQTRTTHDLLERVTASQVWSQNVMKWQTTTGYDGDRVMVTPPTGGIPTTTISNAHGQPIELRQHTAGTTSGAYQATTYAYDRLHRLTTVTDPAGNQWQNTYDPGGRVTESRDPDKGTTTFTHNAAGDVLTSTDARTTTLSYSYDDLGRKTELWHGPVGSGTRRAAWTYDTLTAGGTVKGQLIRSTRYKTANEPYSIEVSAFDDQYRPLETKVSLPATEDTLAGPWTSSTTYKPDGSVATQTYPAAGSLPAETVTVGYDNNGYPLTRAGLDTYISATAYDNGGTVNTRTLGAGAKRVQLTAAVDEATGRLTENRVSTEHPTTPGSFVPQLIEQYGHDNAGNVTSISEVTPAGATVSNQCFTYDSLRQLTEAWTTTTATCQTTPTQAAVGGPDPYWTSYRYNGIGNRTQEIVHTTGGETTRTYTYPASGAGSVRPHAVQNIAITGPSTGIDTYGYDQAGNTTTRNLAGKPGQTLTWDPEGHLATVTDTGGTTSYLYTADGQRLVAYEPGSVTTLYLGGFELRRTTTGVSCTRYYGVASRSTSGGLTWLAADHHSTRQVAIDPTTLATTRRRTDPFGNPRGALPAWPTTRGFLDGTADATGLTHLGAREYEPNAGRFISVDPIMDLADPTQWNGYAYANNNPTTGSDPTGLITCHGRQEGDLCPGQKIGPWAGTPAGDVARDKHFGGGTKHRNTDNSFTGKSNKQEEPTVLDVLDQIVSRATGGTVPTLQGWLDKTCERVGRAKCKILRDSMDRLIKEAGGKPFDCDAFPNSAQCKENFEKWAEEAYEHLEATVTVCDVVCLSFEFQGGYLQLVVGAGSSGFGGTVVWNTRSYSDQGSVSVAVCGAKIIGACYGFGPTVDSDGEWNGVNHAAGIAFGVGGVRPAVAYVVGSYNVHTGEVVGPQDPLPPVIYHMACKLSWWC